MQRACDDGVELHVFFLMAIIALRRCLLAGCDFLLVAIDAHPRSGGRIVESRLLLGLHRRSCRSRMAIGAGLLRGLRRFLRLGRVMAGIAFLIVQLMIEPHPAHRCALQNNYVFGRSLGKEVCTNQHTNKHAKRDSKNAVNVLHVASIE